MDLVQSIIETLASISYQIPLYIGLSPLCLISSSLYSSALNLQITDPTLLLILCLVLVWGVCAGLLIRLVRSRTSKCMFFY
jgi:hypothetical protein